MVSEQRSRLHHLNVLVLSSSLASMFLQKIDKPLYIVIVQCTHSTLVHNLLQQPRHSLVGQLHAQLQAEFAASHQANYRASYHICPRREWFTTYEQIAKVSISRVKVERYMSAKVELHVTQDESDESQQEEKVQQLHSETIQPDPSIVSPVQTTLAYDRPKRSNFGKPTERYGYENVVAYAIQVAEEMDLYEPSTYRDAVTCTVSAQWLAAMGDEMESLQKNKTWDLVQQPTGRKIITWKWVFKKKEGMSPAEGIKYKARVVAKGFHQREGVDDNEIFSPVIRHTSIRVLPAMVAH
ncbi:unnamed protein product [Amaranthus hypochondriacus]